ncbi:hypothetical protein Dthio_PD3369 [Desulfonatronospira thiodismutans ASO3-1]|uniref:Uncharacterized protein n=1 Tax=Desulfonatronospira thiodismutans ASO3-1 TaxID=555779 RepID=D6SML6_9BACT|nr:hypothetical protein Dthio_PD3369 [Desulfonatronospira thiodismutans ASO3-1]
MLNMDSNSYIIPYLNPCQTYFNTSKRDFLFRLQDLAHIPERDVTTTKCKIPSLLPTPREVFLCFIAYLS